jgi:hypothetical protein
MFYYRSIFRVFLDIKAVFIIIVSLFFSASLKAQIYATPQSISGTINTYTAVSAVPSCTTATVASTTGLAAGNKVLLIQMQGPTIVMTNTSTFGSISSINNTGNYEFATISSISGSTITFTLSLVKSYTPGSNYNVQMITVPQYNAGVTITGTLTAAAWNGTTGGVLVFEATTVTMSANIDVSGLGFTGGSMPLSNGGCGTFLSPANEGWRHGQATSSNDTSSTGTIFQLRGAKKGEGIYNEVGTWYANGKGANANGGGGGNEHNGGGGGGSNYGSGGLGGHALIYPNGNCGLPANAQGRGGYPLSSYYSSNKIFMGGGGGEGSQNNGDGTAGTNGGGIVIINASISLSSGGFKIMANGTDNTATALADGGGAGGAGGAILLNVASYTSAITVEAKGGKGSDNSVNNDCYASGGGGGGGAVWLSQASTPGLVTVNVAGGIAGQQTGSSSRSCITSTSPTYGATDGSIGGILFNLSMPAGSASCSLPVELIFFRAELSDENQVAIKWSSAWEKNNGYYEIERSKDMVQWESVAVVAGKINSKDVVYYSKLDTKPYYGISYYRLKQVDVDGRVKYTNIETITINNSNFGVVNVYPNPAERYARFTIEYLSDLNENVSISFTDMLGRTVYAKDYAAAESYNKLEMDISILAKGCYILHIRSESNSYITRVIVK